MFYIFGDKIQLHPCNIATKEHFYHVGGKEKNRNAVYEALLSNAFLKNGIPNIEMKKRIENEESQLTSIKKEYEKPVQLMLDLNEESVNYVTD